MKKIFALIITIVVFGKIGFSQTGETELFRELKKQDSLLNNVYVKLKSQLKNPLKQDLINSQKGWIKFKNSNCILKSQKNLNGGVLSSKVNIDCQIKSTKKRIKELKELISDV